MKRVVEFIAVMVLIILVDGLFELNKNNTDETLNQSLTNSSNEGVVSATGKNETVERIHSKTIENCRYQKEWQQSAKNRIGNMLQ